MNINDIAQILASIALIITFLIHIWAYTRLLSVFNQIEYELKLINEQKTKESLIKEAASMAKAEAELIDEQRIRFLDKMDAVEASGGVDKVMNATFASMKKSKDGTAGDGDSD